MFRSDEKLCSDTKDHTQPAPEQSMALDEDHLAHSENQEQLSNKLDAFDDDFNRRNTDSV